MGLGERGKIDEEVVTGLCGGGEGDAIDIVGRRVHLGPRQEWGPKPIPASTHWPLTQEWATVGSCRAHWLPP